jgi:hypothetical protein
MPYAMRWIRGCVCRGGWFCVLLLFCRYCNLSTPNQQTTQSLNHNHPLSTWQLQSNHSYELKRGDTLTLALSYTGTILRTSTPAVREELLGELAILSNLSMWRWGGIQRWSYFHDRYAPSRARLLRWQGFLTAGQRAEQFWWKSGLGAEYLLQRPNAEPGIAAFVHAALSGAPLAGELQSEGTLYTTERRTYRLQAELAWKEPIAGFQLRGQYARGSQDFPAAFQPERLERRHEERFAISAALQEQLAAAVQMLFDGELLSMTTRAFPLDGTLPPLRRSRLQGGLNTVARVELAGSVFTFGTSLQLTEEQNRLESALDSPELAQRRLQEEQRNYSTLWLQLSLGSVHRLGSGDTLTWRAELSNQRYDTPSRLNTDDRDEQQIAGQLRYIRRLSSASVATAELGVRRQHLVFLSANRSAWNHQLYTLWLRWAVRWDQGRLRWSPQWELLSTYTVRDYPFTRQLQDLSIRQWSYSDSIAVRLHPEWLLELQLLYRYRTVGQLQWSIFAEFLQAQMQEYSVRALAVWETATQAWAAGVQLSHLGGTQFGQPLRQHSIGPYFQLRLANFGRGKLIGRGWYEWRWIDGKAVGRFPMLQLELTQP